VHPRITALTQPVALAAVLWDGRICHAPVGSVSPKRIAASALPEAWPAISCSSIEGRAVTLAAQGIVTAPGARTTTVTRPGAARSTAAISASCLTPSDRSALSCPSADCVATLDAAVASQYISWQE
jgi:hypothetical protein